MGRYDPGLGQYEVRFGWLSPEHIPDSFTSQDWFHQYNQRNFDFYTRLEESIIREGFRNPIMVYEKPSERTFPYGGSRALMAHKLRIPVPAIVSDWVGTFKDWELITSVDQALSKFKDPPTVLEFHPELGCQFWGSRQVQLSPEHQAFFAANQRKADAQHLKRRMTDGQFYYAITGEKQ